MSVSFDTSTVAEGERYEYWRDVVCRLYCDSESQPARKGGFEARLTSCSLGSIEISDLISEPLYFERLSEHVRNAPSDDFLLSVLIEGQGELSQNDRTAVLQPGDAVIYDTARPFTYRFPERYRMILVKVPRAAMLARVPNAEYLTSFPIGGNSPLGALAGDMIRRAVTLDLTPNTTAAAKMGSAVLDMISILIDVQLTGHDSSLSRDAKTLNRAKTYIRAHLDHPGLNVETIAKSLQLSSRTLSRLFAAHGTTVMRWLWNERIKASHRALSGGCAINVSEVALSCGFSNFSHFSRAFKNAYGVPPRTLIRTAGLEH